VCGEVAGFSVLGLVAVGLMVKNASIGFLLGASVTGLPVSILSVGAWVGGGDGGSIGLGVVGLRVGRGVLGGAGLHAVNAMHVIPSGHSVSWPVTQGAWHLEASAQPLPHQ